MLAQDAIPYLCENYQFQTVLDVGSGKGLQAAEFRKYGKEVTETDYIKDGDFMDLPVLGFFGLVWCSHVLEHQPNVNAFLYRLIAHGLSGGLLAITVPPAKHNIVGGHLTIWNEGLLIYNLIRAGLDCRDAVVLKYGYNITAIVRIKEIDLPKLNHDCGDIELLAEYFPSDWDVYQGFHGNKVGREL